jgi:capsular polysaccharide biosynthesis protein
MHNFRRINPAPLGDKDLASRLRESLLGKVYINYLKRFPVLRWVAAWLWRNGYPLYWSMSRAVYKTLPKARPLIRLSAQARLSAENVDKFAEAETVVTPAPKVFPAKDRHYLAVQHDHYVFPEVFLTTVHDAVVTGGTNLIRKGEQILCHDLYDFSRDYTSEETHGRTVITRTGGVKWLMNSAVPEELIPVAASFVDACALNYAHWLTEVLPRIALFCSRDQLRDVPIIVDDGLHKNLMESLLLVAGPLRTVFMLPLGRALRVERLFAVSPTGYVPFGPRSTRLKSRSHGTFSPVALNLVANKIASGFDPAADLPRKIVIRRNSGIRRMLNADDIEQQLVNKGFTIVEPEKLSLREQVRIFSSAEVVVGATGAAFANIVFCRPTARIIIMISKHENMPYWYWQHIACSVGCSVEYVLGDIVRGSDLGIHGDFHIDPRHVLEAIDSAN